MSSKLDREKRYQAIRLYNSGAISLTDLKNQFRVVSAVTHNKFTATRDQKDVLATEKRLETLERLTMTRDQAKQKALMKLSNKPKLTATRDEEIARFVTKYQTGIPANYSRYGILEAKTKRVNPPRPGTSKKKISQGRYEGFDKFNKDYDRLMKALLKLLTSGGSKSARKGVGKALSGVANKVKVSVNPGKR
jgi:hypothetical protein|tara:strand:- start:189 stop:764 length:576 start_codon:yes stop_codon:yes gene_type:complete